MSDYLRPPEFQTTFGYDQDHFSPGHANHWYGSTAPVQHDFGLNLPDGRFKKLYGEDSPLGHDFQTKLTDFFKP